jgi:membrane protease subunit (stomatin/prohibitin family)
MLNLETANIPFWTTVSKIMQGFESEHKVGIYFFKTTTILDQKWGTLSDIKYQDSKSNLPVSLRAFGNFSFRIVNANDFFTHFVGEQDSFSTKFFRSVMNSRLVEPLTSHLAKGQFPYIEIDAKREEISNELLILLGNEFANLGLKIEDFCIEGTVFCDDSMRRINRVANLGADVQAASTAGISFAQLQHLEAMRDAAKNENGGAGVGVGIGAGVALGQGMVPIVQGVSSHEEVKSTIKGTPKERLQQLKEMLEEGPINDSDFNSRKAEILAEI